MKRFLSFAIVITFLCLTFAIDTLNAAPPSTQAFNIAFSNVTSTSARITVTRGNGTDRIIVVRLTTDAAVPPTDGHPYTVSSSNYSSPDSITGTGNSVIYSGTARAVLVTGLSAGRQYTVTVYERNNGAYEYNTSAANNNPRSFYTIPPAPTAGAYTNVASSSFTANWTAPTAGTFDGYIITVANNASFSPALNWYDNLSLGSTGSSYDIESVSTPPSTTITPNTYYWARIRSTQYDKMSAWVNLGSVVTLPVAPTLSASSVTICQGDGYTITPIGPTLIGNGPTDHKFNLYAAASGGSPLNGTPQTSLTVNPLVSTTYYVATYSNYTGLESATRTAIAITVNPAAIPANAGPDQCIVGALTATLAGSSPSPGAGAWTMISGPGSVTFAPDNITAGAGITVSTAGSYVFRWSVSVSGCTTTTDDVNITFYPAIVAASITTSTPVNLCGSLSTSIAAVNPGGGIGAWTYTATNGGTLSFNPSASSPNATITSSGYDSYSLTWTVYNPCSNAVNSTAGPLVVNFDMTPTTSNAGPDQMLCASAGLASTPATLAGNTVGAHETGTWTASVSNPGTATFSNINSPTSTATVSAYGQYTYYWTITSQFGVCTPSVDSVVIGYYAPPSTAIAGGPYTGACGSLSATLAGNTPAVGNGIWTVTGSPSGSNPTFDDNSLPGAVLTSDMYGVYTLTWTVSTVDGACTASTSTTTVTLLQNATIANAGADQNICGLSGTMAGNTPSIGTGAWSVVSGNPGDISFTTSSSPTSGVTSTNYGTYSFRWTITNGTCSTTDDVGVTFWQTPTANAGPDQPNACSPVGGPYTATLAASPSVGTGLWQRISGPGSASFSNVNSATALVTFSTPGLYGLTWTETNGPCSTKDTVYITSVVNIAPSAAGSISGTSSVCPNQTGVTYSVGTISNASTYNWTVPSGATIASGSNTNMITVNFGTASGNVTVAGVNSCGSTGTSSTLAVTVLPTVGAAGVPSGTTPVCQGQSGVVYSIGTVSGATSYNWSVPSGASIVGSSTGNSITVNFSTSSSSGNVSVYGSNSCGTGTSNSLAVTVNAIPDAAGSISGSQMVCQSTSGAYSVGTINGATSYAWTVPSGASISGGSGTNMITVNFGTASGNITVAGVNTCGTGTSSTLAITVSAPVAAAGSISGSQTVCQNTTGMVYTTGTIANATSYTWTVPTGASIVGGGSTNMITVNFGTASGNVTVAGVNVCGTGTSASLAITIEQPVAAAGAISGTSPICANSTTTYSVGTITNATSYVWSVPSGAAITSGSSTNMITVNLGTASGNVMVYGMNSCGSGSSSTLAVTVENPVSSANPSISGSATVCENQTGVVYSVPAIANATSYNWAVPSGATIAGGSNTNMITVNFGTTSGNVTVYGANSCGSGGMGTLGVTVNTIPSAAGSISGNNPVCANSAGEIYSVAAISGASTYAWTIPTGASFTGASTGNMITVNFGTNSGNITVVGINACGTGTSASLPITIESPVGSAGTPVGSATACQSSVQTYSVAPISNATSYTWTLPSGSSISSGSGTNAITVNFGSTSGSVGVFGSNSCGAGASGALTVTIDLPVAAAGVPSGATTVCSMQTGVVYSVAPIAHATSYVWSVPSGASIASQSNNMITVNFGSSAGNVSVYGMNSCGSGTSNSLGVTINPLPSAAGSITGPTAVCANSAGVEYSVGTISNATSYVWSVPSDASIVGGSNTNMITVNFGTASGNVTVYGMNACGSGTQTSMAITIESPVGSAATPFGSATACQNSTQTYSVAPITNATSYTWTLPGGSTITSGSNTNMITVNFGTTSGSVSVFGSNSCGAGTSGALTVTIELPVAAASAPTGSTLVCANQTGVTYSAAPIANATSYVWTLPAGATITGGSNTNAITVNFGSTGGNVTVAGVNTCGTGTSASLGVSINPLPSAAGTVVGSSSVCAGQTGVTYSVGTISNATSYVWSVPSDATITGGSNTNMITVNFGTVSGNVMVYGMNACGSGASNSTTVTVIQQVATASTPSGSASVCANQSGVVYTTSVLPNATSYVWSVPAGASIASQSSNMITVNFGSTSGNVTVYGMNSCFTGGTGTLAVAITQPVAAASTPSGATSVCPNQAGVVYTTAVLPNATSYVWTVPVGASIANQSANMVTVNFGSTSGNVTVYGQNSCFTGTSASLGVTVNPLPSAAGTISGTTSICANSTGIIYTVGTIANATSYAWTLPSGATFSGSSTGNSVTVNFGSNSGNITVAGVNACGSGASNLIGVTVSTLVVSNAGSDQSIGGLSGTMSGNAATPGTGTWTKISGPGTPTFSNVNSETSNITVNAYGTYILRWTIVNGACSSFDDVQLTFNSAPTQLVFQTIPTPKVTGVAFNVVIEAQDATNTPTNVSSNTPFTITENGAGSLSGGSVTGTILSGNNNSGNVSVTYNVLVDTVGETGVTLHVEDNGGPLNDNNSNVINMLPKEPTVQADSINFVSRTQHTIGITWKRGNGTSCMVYVAHGPASNTDNPTDGTGYTASTHFNTSSIAFGSSKVVFIGNGTTVTVDSLTNDERYAFKVVELYGSGTLTNYNTTNTGGIFSNNRAWYTLSKEGLPQTGGDMNMSASAFKPNPAQDYVEFNLSLAQSTDVTINVYDEAGNLVLSPFDHVNFVQGTTPVRMNLRGLATGAYSVVITSNNELITDKVVIKK